MPGMFLRKKTKPRCNVLSDPGLRSVTDTHAVPTSTVDGMEVKGGGPEVTRGRVIRGGDGKRTRRQVGREGGLICLTSGLVQCTDEYSTCAHITYLHCGGKKVEEISGGGKGGGGRC